MTDKRALHPTETMLEEFATGNLSTGKCVAIAAHVELCAECRQRTSEIEAQATLAWLAETGSDSTESSSDYASLVDSIVAQPQFSDADEFAEQDAASPVREIHMHERSITLPSVLARIASDGLVWKKLAGGINQASVMLDDETQCEFLYMKPGSQVPVHKHQGNEITLVLDGSFSDAMGNYGPSDFVVRTPSHTHQPASDEGCLCFAVLDSPLTFTKGLARLFNPVNRYRFKRATSQRV